LSDLKELNQAAPRFTTQELDQHHGIQGPSAESFQGGGNVGNLFILFRLLMMQSKWTFVKLLSLSTPLVCAG